MPEYVPPRAIPVVITAELKEKMVKATEAFVEAASAQGLTAVECLAAIAMLQKAYGEGCGGYLGAIHVRNKDGGS